jgi:hypothetical protein
MLRAVGIEIAEIKSRIKDRFMSEKGYKKLNDSRKKELESAYAQNEDVIFYEAVRSKLEDRY